MNNNNSLRLYLQSWLNTSSELSYSQARTLWEASDFEQSFDDIWDELEKRQWLKPLINGNFGLTPPAVRYSQNNPNAKRLSPKQADDITLSVIDRVNTWNKVAIDLNLPTICAAFVWGSVASQSSSHGDVDICLMFRRSNLSYDQLFFNDGENYNYPPSSLQEMSLKCFLATQNIDSLTVSEIEDLAFEWIDKLPFVNASGLDQWDELAPTQENFVVKPIYKDKLLKSKEDCGPNVKSYEVETIFRHCSQMQMWKPREYLKFCLK